MKKSIHLLYGPPACGKTTIAENILEKREDVEYISVGKIVRDEISKFSIHGLRFKKYLDSNSPYPPELVGRLISKLLTKNNKPLVILDGFPKYLTEADFFVSLIRTKKEYEIKKIIYININLNEALRRVSSRRICSSCLKQCEVKELSKTCLICGSKLVLRDDDNVQKLKSRFSDFEKSKSEVVKVLLAYKPSLKILEIDGTKSKDLVAFSVNKVLNDIV